MKNQYGVSGKRERKREKEEKKNSLKVSCLNLGVNESNPLKKVTIPTKMRETHAK